jgi:putative addiction module antidote
MPRIVAYTVRGVSPATAAPALGPHGSCHNRPNFHPERIMHALKLTPIGDGLGVVLPAEILAELKLKSGDTVFAESIPDGVQLKAHDPAFDEQMAIGREFMAEYHETFRNLAK